MRVGRCPNVSLNELWTDLGGDPEHLERVTVHGPDVVLPSVFDVTGFASDTVALASLAVAELWATRSGSDVPAVDVGRRRAGASFRSESLLTSVGWELPPVWDPVAGDYETADGWIRLHTNYQSHRDAAMGVLDTDPDRDAVTRAVAHWAGEELESAVIAAGGCAAVMRTEAEWKAHPAGSATAGEVPVVLGPPVPVAGGSVPDLSLPIGAAPLAGIRVLDLTRVIAGPVATGILAGYGADVIRVDPPRFEEVTALLPITTAGKRCVALDLHRPQDQDRFRALVAQAHLVVSGLRPGALPGLGFDLAALRALNPAIVDVTHDAYGWSGPWAGRRGFDSLVQMSTGIAAAGMAATGSDHPVPLPAQALDHGTGHLLAAGACRALTRLASTGATADVRGSLVGASNTMRTRPTPEGTDAPQPAWTDDDLRTRTTAWGAIQLPPAATDVEGHDQVGLTEAGPLGRHQPEWTR